MSGNPFDRKQNNPVASEWKIVYGTRSTDILRGYRTQRRILVFEIKKGLSTSHLSTPTDGQTVVGTVVNNKVFV